MTGSRETGLDRSVLLVVPGVLVVLLLFIYPFIYGLILSFEPKAGSIWANYARFFSEPRFKDTLGITFWIAVPATLINLGLAIPMAFKLRRATRLQRFVTTLLVIPITLGTVLVAEGLLNYLGPQGWLNRVLVDLHLVLTPVRLTHNYWGVLLSLVITGFPFAFLLTLSYITGIDPVLAQAASTLGAGPSRQFLHIYLPLLAPGLAITFCLAFVQAFSVFPSAVLLGAPAGPTRVISIAAYQAAFEDYDYAMASAVAMIMGAAQLVIVVAVLGLRNVFYRGPAAGAKG
ncbi:MAG TPA: sugar ABC transporter permease [Alphaproteobacteria bacterium]|nr:sugar ABC transporter permease [Alphaproteobacteria bacterium]